jgi:predicted phage-related endonuclease
LFFGTKLLVFTVKRDDEMIASLTEIVHNFWNNYVLTRIAPPPDGSEDARRALGRVFRSSKGDLLDGTPEIEALVRTSMEARDAETAATLAKEEAGNSIRAAIADGAGFIGRDWKATWANNANGSPSWKSIAEELGASPELIAKHTPPGARVLRVTAVKENTSKSKPRAKAKGGQGFAI